MPLLKWVPHDSNAAHADMGVVGCKMGCLLGYKASEHGTPPWHVFGLAVPLAVTSKGSKAALPGPATLAQDLPTDSLPHLNYLKVSKMQVCVLVILACCL